MTASLILQIGNTTTLLNKGEYQMNLLYIDPGTGSMLFSLVMGISIVVSFAIKSVILKIKFIFSGGKAKDNNSEAIPFVIFSDHKRYWNIFEPICDEFERRKIPLVYYTQSPDDPVLDKKYQYVNAKFIGEGNKGIVKMNMLNAGTVMSTTPGLDVLQWKRSKNVKKYVHIPHTVDDLSSYRMFGLDHYDAVLCTGQNQIDLIRKIESLRPNLPAKELKIVGSPNMDEALLRVKSFEKIKNKTPVVLLAPSWGPSSILNRFGKELITALLDSGFHIIVRPHPQSYTAEKELLDNLKQYFDGKNIEWNKDNDNLAVLNRSDILITDFSGIIFDYSFLFGKPVIYADTNFDTSVYDADWLDEKMWTLRAAEKIGIKLEEKEFNNIKAIIQNAINNTDYSQLENVKNECWQNIGSSTKSIVDYVTGQN